MFLKKLMLIKQVNQKRVIFVSLLVFLNKGFKFQTNVCNRCHDLLMMSVNLSNITILKIKNSDYCCIITKISKSEAINSRQNTDSTEKCGIV